MPNLLFRVPAVIVFMSFACAIATAQEIMLERPGDRDFILDKAGLTEATTREEIRTVCDQLLTDQVIPIIVVTIDSMAQHGGQGMSIESFAQRLFNQWGIGHTEFRGASWNRGILLLVSKNDRKARIELGADWAHDFDPYCERIMQEQIIPNFKNGDFDEGIKDGVVALDAMARGLDLPPPVRPKWLIPAMIGGIALLIFTVVSLIRSGASGWAWLFWGAVFGLIFMILIGILRNAGNGGGAGFSGGSFGGGFSGGGGATGSW